MSVVVSGTRHEIFTKEKVHEGGRRTAGTGQITHFAFDSIQDEKTFQFWLKYKDAMKNKLDLVEDKKRQIALRTAIKGFDNALFGMGSDKYVAYSTLDPDTTKTKSPTLEHFKNIQMCVTVSVSKKPFFASTHMGIFRSPLVQEKGHAYGHTLSKRISITLHQFAAKALELARPHYNAQVMITQPMDYMGGMLTNIGGLKAFKVKSKEDMYENKQGVAYTMPTAFSPIFYVYCKRLKIDVAIQKNELWLSALAFNPQHNFGTTFNEFSVLKENPSILVNKA